MLYITDDSTGYITELHVCSLIPFATVLCSELWLSCLQFWTAWTISPVCSLCIKQSFSSHLTLSYQIKVAAMYLRSFFSGSYSAVHLPWGSFAWIPPSMVGAQLRRHWPSGFLKPKYALPKFLCFSVYLKISIIIRKPLFLLSNMLFLMCISHIIIVKSANTHCILIPCKALPCPSDTHMPLNIFELLYPCACIRLGPT